MGAHISTAGGFSQVVPRALAMGAEAVQVFSSNPRTWRKSPPDRETLTAFATQLRENHLPLFFHTIYLVNLASPDLELRRRSALSVAHALVLGALAGATGVVTHVGSHRGQGFDKAVPWVKDALDTAFRAADQDLTRLESEAGRQPFPPLLLETATGSGATAGDRLDDLAVLLTPPASPGPTLKSDDLGLCLDTAHLFAAGYALHELRGLEGFLAEMKQRDMLGLVRLIHLNDSASPFASRRDRHANPGEGEIGHDGLARVVGHPALAHVPFVLEVPGTDRQGPGQAEIALIKAMREGTTPSEMSPGPK